MAAVVISVIHVSKENLKGPFDLDGRTVPLISAFLFHSGGNENPAILNVNKNQSFQGSVVVGLGFTFDDADEKGMANSLAEMHQLLRNSPLNSEAIFPYIGGEELNDSPTLSHHRYIINFGDISENDARNAWPDLMAIVERKVKPERLKRGVGGSPDRVKRAEKWWQFSRFAKELYDAIKDVDRVLVCSQTSKYLEFAFLPINYVFSNKLVVINKRSWAAFSILQSQMHQYWADFMGSSMKDDPVYTPSDCFETFPFPKDFESNPALEKAGQEYYEYRATLMVQNNEGLTKTYNRFHDPDETSPEIHRLRELHAAMDRAVLDAYGWTDIPTNCDFILDYDDKDEEVSSRRKKPWRYRWPDEVRDDVLAKLLALNAERAEEERLAGLADMAQGSPKKRGKKKNSAVISEDGSFTLT